jgi:hypothetical protein
MSERDDDLIRGRNTGPVLSKVADARADTDAIRARQRSRARIMAVLLGAFVILVFAISIVKIQLGHPG